ncbi:oxysterol-binding protein-related protein 4C-like isoform X2 [Ananas comosus]|uniref:Oxysterol-binding protein-related protein 4C-like isoform X2 n=1 Tax=Ananas comosus TaxID=4615 RepID=A0A6P5F1I4_ANACO|nr:oxysterol-binding protein-related protein 4C-like isoform X2 [Ananas comosus]
MVEEEEEAAAAVAAATDEGLTAVLTPPLALDGDRPPNVVQRVFSLFRNVRPGSDLTHFQLPPLFNMPKSQLQLYGEGVYCIGEDYLSKCAKAKSSLERFTSVVAWSISTTRPAIFGLAPFNPILGETHHVSKGTLNVLLEQVAHHPPVSALHATDQEENIQMVWCHNPVPKFHGTSVEAVIHGKRQLRLLSFGENYEMNSPNLLIRILPTPAAEWAGTVRISCKDSGLEAEMCFHRSHSFLGFGGNSRAVKGKIFHSKSLKTIYEIDGLWDRTVSLKDVHSGKFSVLYDAEEAISKLKAPIVKDRESLLLTESAVVWGEVSQAILNKDWERAFQAKRSIEERERKKQRERKSMGEVWIPKHFSLSHTKEGQWECWPLKQAVPPAPIVVPPQDKRI